MIIRCIREEISFLSGASKLSYIRLRPRISTYPSTYSFWICIPMTRGPVGILHPVRVIKYIVYLFFCSESPNYRGLKHPQPPSNGASAWRICLNFCSIGWIWSAKMIKGGITSESFSLWFKSPKLGAKSQLCEVGKTGTKKKFWTLDFTRFCCSSEFSGL